MIIRYGKFQIIPTSMVHLQMRMVAGGSYLPLSMDGTRFEIETLQNP
jgi:hypothetical protein